MRRALYALPALALLIVISLALWSRSVPRSRFPVPDSPHAEFVTRSFSIDSPVDGASLTVSFRNLVGDSAPMDASPLPEGRRDLIRLLRVHPEHAPEIVALFERTRGETLAMALAAVPSGPAVDRMIELARTDAAAMIALMGRTDPRSLETLFAHMEPDDPLRRRAAEVLLTVVDDLPSDARAVLAAKVRAVVAADPDAASIMLMADLGVADVDALIAAAGSGDAAIEAAARRALAEAGGDMSWMEALR